MSSSYDSIARSSRVRARGGAPSPHHLAATWNAIAYSRNASLGSSSVACSPRGRPPAATRPAASRLSDARALEGDHRRLVEARRLHGDADLRRHLRAALDERLLGRLGRLAATPEDDRLGTAVLLVVEADVALVAVVAAQHRDHRAADHLQRGLALAGVCARERDYTCVHRPSLPIGRANPTPLLRRALGRALAAALLAPEHQGAGDPRKREPEQRLVRPSALDGRSRALCLAFHDALADLPDAPSEDGVAAVDAAHARSSSTYRVLSRPLPCTPLSPLGALPLLGGGGGGAGFFFGGGGLCGLWVFAWCRVWPVWWPGFAFFACWTPWPRARDGGGWLTSPPCVGFWGWAFFTSGLP